MIFSKLAGDSNLSLGELVLWVRGEPRVHDLLNGVVALEEPAHLQAVLLVLLHSVGIKLCFV